MCSSIWIHAAVENVWQAVTEEQYLSQWYAPGSTWNIPKLAAGEKMIFTLMPNDHNQLADPLPMQLTIQQVKKTGDFFHFTWKFQKRSSRYR
ncbi:hypothetical protein OL548_19060 [Lysinibacillus sp. MHQ-1]|nr:hypothetical protein OL548_19060 [Lysinibacillus sp. MHQ-1]